ncbi:MAG TPA: signal peptidase I, partial [Lachnospiraceae bacterium]|nr:signal peptidase I [Lachnospiraceae bacterium]
FYYNNRILVKRIVALPGETVEIGEDGTVLVDGRILEEPYLAAKAKGSSDLKEALTVPKDAFFVLGDERATSIDSRRTEIGCVKTGQLAGKVLFIFPGSEDG